MQVINRYTRVSSLLVAMLFISGCFSSSGSDDEGGDNGTASAPDTVDTATAEQSVIAFLESQGFFSSEYFQQAQVAAMVVAQGQQDAIPPVSDDYVRSEIRDGNILLRLDIDGNGNILPSRDWRNENSGYCLEKGKYFRTPMWQFQVQLDPESQLVVLRLLDAGTGGIEEQADAQVPGDSWVDDGISEAWGTVNLPQIQQADSPCGAEIEMTLVVESEITASTHDELFERAKVESRIPLGQESETDVFEGTATLTLTDYDSPVGNEPNVINCSWTATLGSISGKVKIPDGNFESVSIDDLQGMIDVSIRVLQEEAPVLTQTCTVQTPDGSGESSLEGQPWYPWFHVLNQSQDPDAPFSYFYESLWEAMPDDDFGLAAREVEQEEVFTEEGDTLTLQESTSLEIRTEILPPL